MADIIILMFVFFFALALLGFPIEMCIRDRTPKGESAPFSSCANRT